MEGTSGKPMEEHGSKYYEGSIQDSLGEHVQDPSEETGGKPFPGNPADTLEGETADTPGHGTADYLEQPEDPVKNLISI